MTQVLHPLFGEYLTDISRALETPLPMGVYAGMNPTISGAGGVAGWTATLSPEDGWSMWRPRGNYSDGRYTIQETAAVQVHIDSPDATHSRIDLIVGVHRRVVGPVDPVTLKPTGAFITEQHATYEVVKGTPSATPVAPTVADPYDGFGARAVILAKVTVPVIGSASVERYTDTDLRIDFMRLLCQEVVDAKSPYSTLKSRLDALGVATQVQSLSFRGATVDTGSPATLAAFTPSSVKLFGNAVSQRSATTFGLTESGLYEVIAMHKIEGGSDSASAIKCWLVYNGGAPVLVDNQNDTSSIEVSQDLYAQIYVDPSWTDPYIYIERGGWPSGYFRGSVKYLGDPVTLKDLAVATTDISIFESPTQTYPDDFTVPLAASNAVGAVTWSVVAGGGLLDGTTEPKAEIVSGNFLKITWASRPASLPGTPATYSVKVQAQDSAAAPRVASKTLGVSLGTAVALAITNTDLSLTPSAYPYTVSFSPLAVGGSTPYTWAIVAGADTTLTGAAISGGLVTGTISADGTVKVRIRVTDFASTVVEKVINIASTLATSGGGGGGGGGGCVPAGTMIETVDGPVPVETIRIGTLVRAYDDQTFEPIITEVEEVFIYEQRAMAKVVADIDSLPCSRDHRLYRKESRKTTGLGPHWPPACELLPGDHTLYEIEPGVLVECVVLDVELTDELATVYHVRLKRGHVFVAGRFPAHNMKAADV